MTHELGGLAETPTLVGADQTSLGLLELVLQLLDDLVHSGKWLGGSSSGPDDPPVPGHDDFATFTVGDSRVVLLAETHLGLLETRAVSVQPAHFLFHEGPDFVGHDPAAIRDDNIHLLASWCSALCFRVLRPVLLIGPLDRF
jgi:hypothetical protein